MLAAEALQAGTYGGQHWKIVLDNHGGTTGSVEGDCSTGNITDLTYSPYQTNVGQSVNFTIDLQLQFTSPATAKTVTVNDGLVDKDNVTLTGTMVADAYSEKFKVVLLATPDLFKCISAASSVRVQWLTAAFAFIMVLMTQ